MALIAKKWRRYYEAARKGKELGKFEADLQEEIKAHDVRRTGGRGISIRDLFENFVDDGREIVQSWSPRSGGGETGINLHEAGVDTANFANITGQIVYSMVLDTFNDPVYIAPQLARTVPTGFSGERIPGVTQLGDAAESVGEGEAYPIAGVSEEWVETPETTKRGFIVPLTKEAVYFDRTGLVLQRCGKVTESLAINKEKRAIDCATGVTSTYRRNGGSTVATYGDNSGTHDWDNLAASNALQDWTDVENALLLFDDLTDPNTGEPILVNPDTILVPTALRATAQRILSATEVRETTNTNTVTISGNPFSSARTGATQWAYNIVSSQYVKARTSSASTWFIGQPMEAFYYMENWPIQAVQAPSNSELEFTNDIVMRWKVSERGAYVAYEPRRMVKATA